MFVAGDEVTVFPYELNGSWRGSGIALRQRGFALIF
jgi:hypothetical protein